MRLLVTGASGQVGREVVELSAARKIPAQGLAHQDLDIADSAAVDAALAHYQPSIMINTAAYTAVDQAESEVERALQVNRDGVANLGRSCAKRRVPVIHLSTDYIFDGNKVGAYIEDDTPSPLSAYGRSKLEGEVALQETQPEHIIIRTSWVFGRYGKNFVKTMLRLAGEGKPLRIVSDQCGCPTSAADIAEAILTICQQIADGKTAWGTYHYCGSPVTTWYDFAVAIFQSRRRVTTSLPPEVSPITTGQYPVPARRPRNSEMDCAKIQRVFGIVSSPWLPRVDELVAQG